MGESRDADHPVGSAAARPDEHLLSTLNPRELEVLAHLAVGQRNRAIAEELGISQRTIKFHVASVLKKLDDAEAWRGRSNRNTSRYCIRRSGIPSARHRLESRTSIR